MATAANEVKVFDSINGRTEHPPNSNHVFVWDYLIKRGLAARYFDGQPYCAGGIVYTNDRVKSPQLKVSSPYYVPSRVQWARAHGFWVPSAGAAEPGDEAIFAWTPTAQRAGFGEHVERVVTKPKNGVARTFGFNTSSGRYGSQANGDGCFYRNRPLDATFLGVIKYSRLLNQPVAPAHRVRINLWKGALQKARLPIGPGSSGDAVRAVQWAVGCFVDGQWGPVTDHAVRVFQRYHVDRNGKQLVQDGVVGRLTQAALLTITHYEH